MISAEKRTSEPASAVEAGSFAEGEGSLCLATAEFGGRPALKKSAQASARTMGWGIMNAWILPAGAREAKTEPSMCGVHHRESRGASGQSSFVNGSWECQESLPGTACCAPTGKCKG